MWTMVACALASATSPVAGQDAPASVREVLELNSRLEAAIARGDAAAIAPFFAEEFRLQNSANRILTADQVLAQFRTGVTRFSDYRRTIEAAYASGDTVVLMGAERVTPTGAAPVTRRFTSIWRRTAGGWRQIARQSTNISSQP